MIAESRATGSPHKHPFDIVKGWVVPTRYWIDDQTKQQIFEQTGVTIIRAQQGENPPQIEYLVFAAQPATPQQLMLVEIMLAAHARV